MIIRKKKPKVAAWISLVCYIICIIVLMVEASMDGPSSASQSNAVGGTLANFFNDIKGDQTVAVAATDLNIKNKIEIGYVGDEHKLDIENLPKDSTYKSVVYSSSNTKVASINNNGVISFLNPGHVTIEAINEKYTSIKDSFEIEVLTVEATSFEASIENLEKDKDGVYTIYLSNEYTIQNTFTPKNTTNKDVTYKYDKNYLEITEKGKIIPKKYSGDEIINIEVKHKELTNVLKVKIDHQSVIRLTDFKITPINDIYVTQSYTPKIDVEPSNATFKDYTLISSDSSILKVNKNKIEGKKAGTVTLTVSSNYYNVAKSINVTVLAQPALTGITVSNATIYTNEEIKLSYKKVPQYAIEPTVTYESLNPSIATVTNKGVVKGISEGITKIRVVANNQFTQECEINVKPLNITGNEDFTLTALKPNLYYGVEYNLKDILKITDWIPSDIVGKDKISYSLKDSSKGEIINNKTIILNSLGEHQLYVTHTLSNKTNVITFNCTTFDFNITNLDNEVITSKSLNVKQTFMFNIIDEEIDTSNQYYEVTTDNSNIISLTQIGTSYEIKALNEGVAIVKITPFIDEDTDFKTTEITINVSHIKATYIDFSIINNTSKKEVLLNDSNALDVYISSNYSILPIIPSNATISEIQINSSNEEVVSVDANGKMNFNSIGTSTITIKDNISKCEKSFKINVFNLIALNEENPFTIEGKDAEQIKEGEYAIRNGHSGKVKLNFTKNSTYTNVTYTSSNPKIASVGKDGTITPNRMGTVTLTITCDDGMSNKIEISFDLTIKRTDYIQNLSEFFYQVRKGLGHFSAFLILGIFSTLTWLLFFNGWKLIFSIPINFGAGFFMAVLTEYIQTLVPGRYGTAKDVFLDYDGFLVSAITITAIFVLVAIIKGYIKWIKSR